jgi:hypothetical protein
MSAEECYACEAPGTTREHVPPLCLFPERKDTPDRNDFRKNLITVPSCADHNASKSSDDWYLLWVLSTNVVANEVGMRQAMTKLGRGHIRRPALGSTILDSATDIMVVDSRTGTPHESAEAPLDGSRFDRILKLIALGLYRHHFHESWRGELRVHPDFIGEMDPAQRARRDRARVDAFEAATQIFAHRQRYGDNPKVFWYQELRTDLSYPVILRMAFYGGCTATALFGPSGRK